LAAFMFTSGARVPKDPDSPQVKDALEGAAA